MSRELSGAQTFPREQELKETEPSLSHRRVRFLANRAYLDQGILTIVVRQGAMVGGACELHVKEFVRRNSGPVPITLSFRFEPSLVDCILLDTNAGSDPRRTTAGAAG